MKIMDILDAAFFAFSGCAEVAVSARAVPVTGDWLRIERNNEVKVFSDPLQEEASYPQLVPHLYSLACVFVLVARALYWLGVSSSGGVCHVRIVYGRRVF